jgi:hypothetical protein
MKAWFNSAEGAPLKEVWGPFPAFWQDMAGWEHVRVCKKVYMAVSDIRESGDSAAIDVQGMLNRAQGPTGAAGAGADADADADASSSSSSGPRQTRGDAAGDAAEVDEAGDDRAARKRRRKASRWGDAEAETSTRAEASPAADAAASTSPGGSPGAGGVDPSAADMDPAEKEEAHEAARALEAVTERGRPRTRASTRWSRRDAICETFKEEAVRGGLLGVLTAGVKLTKAQEQQMLVLQMQLLLVPSKLERVQADCKLLLDHPERPRSPSPPPTYDSMGVRTNKRDQRMTQKVHTHLALRKTDQCGLRISNQTTSTSTSTTTSSCGSSSDWWTS